MLLAQDNERGNGRAAFWHGGREAFSLPAWVLGFSILGIGSLARDAGFPAGAAALSTAVMWAGPAQAILYAGIAAGSALPALAIAVGLSSARFLPMVMIILPLLRAPGQRLATQVLAAHYVSVTIWVESARRLPTVPREERLAYYFSFANVCIGLSALATLAGYHLVGALPMPLAAGLLFMTPIFFTISLVAGSRTLVDWAALAFGFGLAPVATALVGRDFDLLVLGLVGGTAAYWIGLARRHA